VTTTADRTNELLEATCRVVARAGAHALTMSQVAREAGVSNALLHYYFRTRGELLSLAFAHAEERVYELARTQLAALPTGTAKLARFLELYFEDNVVFDTDEALWNEVWSSALFDPELRPTLAEAYARWVATIVDLVAAGRTDGSLPKGVEPERTGRRLAALVDGLGTQTTLGLLDRKEAAALLRDALAAETA